MPPKARKKNKDGKELVLDPGGRTHYYSHILIYVVPDSSYRAYPLVPGDDEASRNDVGMLDYFGTDQIFNLTKERRLESVAMTFSTNGKSKMFYRIALVAAEVTDEELQSLVDRLNADIRTLSPRVREESVIEFINEHESTRIKAGHDYLDGSSAKKRHRDSANTEDETQGAKHVRRDGYRHEGPALPKKAKVGSKGKKIPDLSQEEEENTDSSTGSNVPKHFKGPQINRHVPKEVPKAEQEKSPERYVSPPPEDYNPAGDRTVAAEEIQELSDKIDQLETSIQVLTGDRQMSRKEFADTMLEFHDTLVRNQRLLDPLPNLLMTGDIAQYWHDAELPPEGLARLQERMEALAPQPSTSGRHELQTVASGGSDTVGQKDPEAFSTAAESRLRTLFPINEWTEPMAWLMGQDIVQEFVRHEVLRNVYTRKITGRPDVETTITEMMNYVTTRRFLGHCGSPKSSGSNLDWGRAPYPFVLLQIFMLKIESMGKPPLPVAKRNQTQIMRDRCNGMFKSFVQHLGPFQDSMSVQERAMHLRFERIDFFQKHKWLFAQNVDEGGWSYNEELRRARRILKSSKKDIVEDLQFDHTAHTVPDDVDRTYFPNMQCGDVIRTREEAAQILQELTEQKLTIPLLPERVWQILRTPITFTDEELADEYNRQKKKKDNRAAKGTALPKEKKDHNTTPKRSKKRPKPSPQSEKRRKKEDEEDSDTEGSDQWTPSDGEEESASSESLFNANDPDNKLASAKKWRTSPVTPKKDNTDDAVPDPLSPINPDRDFQPDYEAPRKSPTPARDEGDRTKTSRGRSLFGETSSTDSSVDPMNQGFIGSKSGSSGSASVNPETALTPRSKKRKLAITEEDPDTGVITTTVVELLDEELAFHNVGPKMAVQKERVTTDVTHVAATADKTKKGQTKTVVTHQHQETDIEKTTYLKNEPSTSGLPAVAHQSKEITRDEDSFSPKFSTGTSAKAKEEEDERLKTIGRRLEEELAELQRNSSKAADEGALDRLVPLAEDDKKKKEKKKGGK